MLVIQRPTVEAIGEEDGNRQRFAIGPLEPGFGHTIGNSLRRTLLSSIPGAAVTQVRFDDALHEFDTIEGVTEDVTDIILNLKDIVLQRPQPTSRSPCASTCAARPTSPPATSSASADVEILNPGPAHRHAQRQGPPGRRHHRRRRAGATCRPTATRRSNTIGVIPVDSIFSPVRRVTFQVEPTRVEQSTEFDRLVLDIETDGSITPARRWPRPAPRCAPLVQLVEEMSDEPQGLELGEVAAPPAGSPDLDLPIEDLDLSERPRNCLKRAQVNTIGELLEKTEDDLLAITNFGQKSLDEVIAEARRARPRRSRSRD